MSDEGEDQERGGLDVGRLDAVLGRMAGAVAVLGLAGYLLVTKEPAPLPVALLLIGVYAAAKFAVLVLGLRAKWPAWPAALCELLAVGCVARIVATGLGGSESMLLAVCIVGLLLGAGMLRRRAMAE